VGELFSGSDNRSSNNERILDQRARGYPKIAGIDSIKKEDRNSNVKPVENLLAAKKIITKEYQEYN
jgi:hypothetical protein